MQTKYDRRAGKHHEKLDVDTQQRCIERIELNLRGAVVRSQVLGIPDDLIRDAINRILITLQ
jgi:hypothetical protein